MVKTEPSDEGEPSEAVEEIYVRERSRARRKAVDEAGRAEGREDRELLKNCAAKEEKETGAGRIAG
jgi:hypothetical protein